jgi:hypothetical protein
MDANPIASPHSNDHRYFWADSSLTEAEDGHLFVGRYHIAVPKGGDVYSIRRNDTEVMERPESGMKVTEAYSRSEAETAVRRADTKYQALQSDEQLEFDL